MPDAMLANNAFPCLDLSKDIFIGASRPDPKVPFPETGQDYRWVNGQALNATATSRFWWKEGHPVFDVDKGAVELARLYNYSWKEAGHDKGKRFSLSCHIHQWALSLYLRFADDIDLTAGTEKERQDLTTRLETRSVSDEKSKTLLKSTSNLAEVNIKMNGQKLEEGDSFKYLGSLITKDGSSTKEIRTRLSLASLTMTKLDTIWKNNTISLPVKIRLYKSLVISILLYGCESWTLNGETERRLQAFERKCYRKLLRIHYSEHKTNEYVRQRIDTLAGKQKPLLFVVKRRKFTSP
ncbi:hypothetical protein ACOMHN_055426 [Nucella lapillus]